MKIYESSKYQITKSGEEITLTILANQKEYKVKEIGNGYQILLGDFHSNNFSNKYLEFWHAIELNDESIDFALSI
jgi:hypothetical protein